jgi:hypothetical protein
MKLYEGATEHQDLKKRFCEKKKDVIKNYLYLYIVVTIFWTFFQNKITKDEVTFIVRLVTEASPGSKYCNKLF